MAALQAVVRKFPVSVLVKNKNSVIAGIITRNAGHWYKDWKPAPYPQTQKEREAAAKKYNLIPEDYAPYDPNRHDAKGDYPEIPVFPAEARDPYEIWDYPSLRRNYSEVFHYDADLYTCERYNPHKRYYIPLYQQVILTTVVISTVLLLAFGTRDIYLAPGALAKQYPKPGVAHYTYQPAN